MDRTIRLYVNERGELPAQFYFIQPERVDRCTCDTCLLDWCLCDTYSYTAERWHLPLPTSPVRVTGDVGNGKWLND